jgi:hypothetical protein
MCRAAYSACQVLSTGSEAELFSIGAQRFAASACNSPRTGLGTMIYTLHRCNPRPGTTACPDVLHRQLTLTPSVNLSAATEPTQTRYLSSTPSRPSPSTPQAPQAEPSPNIHLTHSSAALTTKAPYNSRMKRAATNTTSQKAPPITSRVTWSPAAVILFCRASTVALPAPMAPAAAMRPTAATSSVFVFSSIGAWDEGMRTEGSREQTVSLRHDCQASTQPTLQAVGLAHAYDRPSGARTTAS